MPDDYLAANQRVPVEAPGQRANAHAVVDAELQRLHLLALTGVFALPAFDVGIVGQTAEHCERVIDVARGVGFRQRLITAPRRRNPDFLGSPVEIEPDLVSRKLHERAHAGVGIEQAFSLSIATGGGAEWKQARPVAAVAANRNPGAHNDPDAVAQGVKSLDGRVRGVHHAEHVAGQFECTRVQSRPFRYAGGSASPQTASCSIRHPASRSGSRCHSWGRTARISALIIGLLFSCTRFHSGMSIGMPRA